jgi:hypothetical protein
MQRTCLTHACISFFARTDVGAGGATDSLVQSVHWFEQVAGVIGLGFL